MSFRYNMVNCNLRKHKLNIKISTKAKVFLASDYLPYNIFICLFMGAQGYDIKQNILFQDSQSEINMTENGKKLSTGNSRHIDIHYLFSKYTVESNKISISYCSTEHMLEIFSKIPTRSPVRKIS